MAPHDVGSIITNGGCLTIIVCGSLHLLIYEPRRSVFEVVVDVGDHAHIFDVGGVGVTVGD